MKGFAVFFLLVLVFLGSAIWYYMQHPTDTTMVRQGANWVIMEQNTSQIKK